MKRASNAALALLCLLAYAGSAPAQTTNVTAAHIYMGGVPIAVGTASFTPVDAQGNAISFSQGGGGLNGPTAFLCAITAGALASTCRPPDAMLTTPPNILYDVQITDTVKMKSFTLHKVPGISGATWPLDAYGPPSSGSPVQTVQISYGTAVAPDPCITPSLYVRNASGGLLYICVAGHPVLVTGGGSGGTGFTFRGAWAATTVYAPFDVLTFGGQTYEVSTGFTSGSSFSATPLNLWAQAGAVGATGSAGATGAAGAAGAAGSAGAAATVAIGTVSGLAAGSTPTVSNAGSSSAAVLNFGIPAGAAGATGPTGPAGPGGAAFTFRGAWAATTVYAPFDVLTFGGQTYEVSTGFTSGASFSATPLNLWAQAGATGSTGTTGSAGAAATVAVGTVSPLSAGSTPTVSNSGSSSAAVLNFGIPAGAAGATGTTGSAGAAATVAVGTVSPLSAGSTPTVSNSGSSSAAVLNFGIPAGAAGATGTTGTAGSTGATGQGFTFRGAWAISTAYHPFDVVTSGGQTYEASTTFTSSAVNFAADVSNWNLWAQAGTNAVGSALTANNLSDLGNIATARTNLGLGTAATTAASAYDAAGAAATAQAAAISSANATAANATNLTSGTVPHARLPALVSADIPATPLTSSTSVTLVGPRQYFICTAACTITVPVPAAGYEFCVQNNVAVSTVITFSAIGTSARYGKTDQSAYGTAGTGTFVSGGAAGDKACILGVDSTHYNVAAFTGIWTAN